MEYKNLADCPFCEVKKSHASYKYVKTQIEGAKDKKKWKPDCMVKGRNEPCKMLQICEIVAAIKGVSEEELADVAYKNSCKVFGR